MNNLNLEHSDRRVTPAVWHYSRHVMILGICAWLLVSPLSVVMAQDPVPTVPPTQNRAFDVGVHVQPTQPTVEESVMQGYADAARNQLNLNWIRGEMRWDFIQPQPDALNWGGWDVFFRYASDNNLKVMLTISGAPLWARPDGSDPQLLAPPNEVALYADFVVQVLRRYPNQIHAVEVWEEMNLRSQWASPDGLNASAYLQLLQTTSSAIRSIDPNIIVISGGLKAVSSADESQAIDDFAYLDTLIANGLLTFVDCVGVHHVGYNLPPDAPFDALPPDDGVQFRGAYETPHHSWSFFTTVNTYARKIAVTGLDVPLCVTEFGWASSEDLGAPPPEIPFAADNSLAEQQQWSLQALDLMQDWGFVWLAILWNLNAAPENGFNIGDAATAYSLIRPNFALAPLWSGLAERNYANRTP